jgi:hypothetical protein
MGNLAARQRRGARCAAPVITAPADGSHENDDSCTVPGSAESGTIFGLPDGGEGLPQASAVSDSGNWSIELAEVSESSRSYTAKVSDGAGNVSAEFEARTVPVDIPSPRSRIGRP